MGFRGCACEENRRLRRATEDALPGETNLWIKKLALRCGKKLRHGMGGKCGKDGTLIASEHRLATDWQ